MLLLVSNYFSLLHFFIQSYSEDFKLKKRSFDILIVSF